ncbi:MBL fold metallo-hydrolase [Salarchaeum sp. JOR-1]|uniref:MBL fold metallo-hydrolase n=1 Tax=Salarchaeum sp. JOR-1 TaxID=2599399 RepID=UPI0011986104|nr:MBL fold metallo-hydrolase [Salarchaeum sp. JOR-1]QDX40958.1 MBL fold metallo-hydrolase [Salarchaeum sp. JOR-1]
MVTELATGVYDLELPLTTDDGTRVFHAVAIETDHGVVLVDAGLPNQSDDVRAALDELGHDVDDVSILLFTHQDGDHVGAAADLLADTDAVTMAHGSDVPAIDGRQEPIKGGGERYPPVDVAVELVEGVTFTASAGPVEVVETPGHTPGHVSLHVPDADLLLAGDALIGGENGVEGPNERVTPDLERAYESVTHLAEYEYDRVLCYHGGLVEATEEDVAALDP